jgi:hypothetical protein
MAGLLGGGSTRVLWFAISKSMMLSGDALCHAVPRGWFAIWFANFVSP